MKIQEHSQVIREAMIAHEGAPQVVRNALASAEIDFLLSAEENCERVEKKNGILNYKYPKKGELEKWIENKVMPHIGKITRHGGSYVKTPEPFHAHTDTGKSEEMLDQKFPYKNILIPLMDSTREKPLYTIIFHQKNFGQASHFWRGDKYIDEKPVYNFKVTDYSDLVNYTNMEFSFNDHHEYLSHLPMDSLFGLSVREIIEWRKGDIIFFDCCNLHSSNNFKKFDIIKHSLTYFASKEILS